MNIKKELYKHFFPVAGNKIIDHVLIGIKYTAVQISNGGLGIGYTWNVAHTDKEKKNYSNGNDCPKAGKIFQNFEGENSRLLLDFLNSTNPLQISMSLALVNALNTDFALKLDEDKKENSKLFKALDIKNGKRVAMVGYFKPLAMLLHKLDVNFYIHDQFHSIGSKEELYSRIVNWADSLILTSTSIIGGTFEEIMNYCPKELPVALLGPSTPLVPEIFRHYNIRYLGGTVPIDIESTLKVIRQGGGTRDFQKYGKKVFITQAG